MSHRTNPAPEAADRCVHEVDPLPVRIVHAPEYDNTPEGQARLTFDSWVFGVLVVLTVVGNVLY